MKNLSDSIAYISKKGLVIKYNQSFADACGIPRNSLSNKELIGLLKFSSPEQIMESAYLLDEMMNSNDTNLFWRGEFRNSVNSSDSILNIIVRKCDLLVNGN